MVSVPLLDAVLSPDAEESYDARVGLVAVPRHFSVASARELARSVGADIKEHEAVIFDFSAVTYMDESAALVIEDLANTAQTEAKGCVVAVCPARLRRRCVCLVSMTIFLQSISYPTLRRRKNCLGPGQRVKNERGNGT